MWACRRNSWTVFGSTFIFTRAEASESRKLWNPRHLLPVLDDTCFHGGRTKILLHKDRSGQWLFALQTSAGEHKVIILGIRRLFAPGQQKAGLRSVLTKVDALLKNLHNDPRYAALLKKLNFPN